MQLGIHEPLFWGSQEIKGTFESDRNYWLRLLFQALLKVDDYCWHYRGPGRCLSGFRAGVFRDLGAGWGGQETNDSHDRFFAFLGLNGLILQFLPSEASQRGGCRQPPAELDVHPKALLCTRLPRVVFQFLAQLGIRIIMAQPVLLKVL